PRVGDLRQVDAGARAPLEDDPLLRVPGEDRVHVVLDAEDEAGRRLLLTRLLPADVEPDWRVEGGLLVDQDGGELVLEGAAVLLAREVAGLPAHLGDPAGYSTDHLLDGSLSLGGAELPAEVLLGDDVGGVLRPALRELDTALLEDGVLGIADDRVPVLPLEL